MAHSATRALYTNDSRQAFTIVRALGGRVARPPQKIRRPDGSITETAHELAAAWQDHNAEVYQGAIVQRSELMQLPGPPLAVQSDFDVGPVATEMAYDSLKRNKACGYDEIPSELLAAGGSALACKYSAINQRVRDNAAWPTQWRGGRSQNVWKKKGDPLDPDSHRTLLLADHVGKGLTGMVKTALDPAYVANQPDCQNGV